MVIVKSYLSYEREREGEKREREREIFMKCDVPFPCTVKRIDIPFTFFVLFSFLDYTSVRL